MGALIVSALVAIAAANAAWWWYRDRLQAARIRRLEMQLAMTRSLKAQWARWAALADNARRDAAEQVTSLQERNRMLTDLMGGDRT